MAPSGAASSASHDRRASLYVVPAMSLTCTQLFPTPIFSIRFDDAATLNEALLAAIRARREVDPGVRASNPLGWHSKEDLFTHAAFAELGARITAVVESAARATGYGGVRLALMSSWANVNPKHACHGVHEHPNALFSGAYYVRVPAPRAGVTFHDPRPAKVFYKPLVETHTIYTAEAVTFPVEEGLLLVFPAWLRHASEPNLADDDRVTVSFNYGFG